MELAKNVWHNISMLPPFLLSPIVFYDDSPRSVFSERWEPFLNPYLINNYGLIKSDIDYCKRFSQFMILSNPNEKAGE